MGQTLCRTGCELWAAGSCIFSGLKEEVPRHFSAGISWATYKKREVLLDRHSKIGCYILCRGRAKLYRTIRPSKRLLVKILTPGDTVVIEALSGESWYDIEVQALEDVEVCCVQDVEFHALLERYPSFKEQVIERVVTDYLNFQRVLVRTSPYLGVKERLAYTLLHLSSNANSAVQRGEVIDLPLSEQELSEMIASHRVTVTKTLNEFVERGWIQHAGRRHQIEIIAGDCLKRLIADLY